MSSWDSSTGDLVMWCIITTLLAVLFFAMAVTA